MKTIASVTLGTAIATSALGGSAQSSGDSCKTNDVVATDIEASNGAIHGIDAVVLPQ